MKPKVALPKQAPMKSCSLKVSQTKEQAYINLNLTMSIVRLLIFGDGPMKEGHHNLFFKIILGDYHEANKGIYFFQIIRIYQEKQQHHLQYRQPMASSKIIILFSEKKIWEKKKFKAKQNLVKVNKRIFLECFFGGNNLSLEN